MLKKITMFCLLILATSTNSNAQEPISKLFELYSGNFFYVSNNLEKYRKEYQATRDFIENYANLSYPGFIGWNYQVSNEQNNKNFILTKDISAEKTGSSNVVKQMLVLVILLFLLAIIYIVYKHIQLKTILNEINTFDLNTTNKSRLKNHFKGQISELVNFINQMLEQVETLREEKETLITVDKISGLMNRRNFIETAKKEVSRSERLNTKMALIYCDIDTFKGINIQFGYEMGDQVLKEFADVIKINVQEHDYVCRWGGEIFLILCPETDLESAKNLAESLRTEVSKMEFATKKRITASFGVSERLPNEAFNYLCRRADEALYQAKKTGRNKVCVSVP